MDEVLDKHKQDFNEIRRLCLLSHGLDLTSSDIFKSSSNYVPSEHTKSVLHSLLSSTLLNLAVSIRVNLYQGTIKNELIALDTLAASYYEDDELICKSVHIKDVCDKIIHADTVTKPIFPSNFISGDTKMSFQLKGKHGKKAWTLDLCLELFAEDILLLLDGIEAENT